MWAAESPSSALGLFLLRMLPIPGSDAPPAISAFARCPPWWCTLPELVSEVEVKEVVRVRVFSLLFYMSV